MFLSLSGLTTPALRVSVTGRHQTVVAKWVVGDGSAALPQLCVLEYVGSLLLSSLSLHHVHSWLNSRGDVTGSAGIPGLVVRHLSFPFAPPP